MNLNDLTIGQAKELAAMFGAQAPAPAAVADPHFFEVGKNYIVRTVTMIYTGKLVAVGPHELVLVDAAWIPETERYSDFVAKGAVRECEPYPEGLRVIVGRGSLLDACELTAPLPRAVK